MISARGAAYIIKARGDSVVSWHDCRFLINFGASELQFGWYSM